MSRVANCDTTDPSDVPCLLGLPISADRFAAWHDAPMPTFGPRLPLRSMIEDRASGAPAAHPEESGCHGHDGQHGMAAGAGPKIAGGVQLGSDATGRHINQGKVGRTADPRVRT